MGFALVLSGPAIAETWSCVPDRPVFCGNIHISCAGRTTVPSLGFAVVAQDATGRVEFADGTVWQAGRTVAHSGQVFHPTGDPATARDWVRIDPQGRFSHRIYRQGRALMSSGRCARTDLTP